MINVNGLFTTKLPAETIKHEKMKHENSMLDDNTRQTLVIGFCS